MPFFSLALFQFYLLIICQMLHCENSETQRKEDVPFRLNCKLIQLSNAMRMKSILFDIFSSICVCLCTIELFMRSVLFFPFIKNRNYLLAKWAKSVSSDAIFYDVCKDLKNANDTWKWNFWIEKLCYLHFFDLCNCRSKFFRQLIGIQSNDDALVNERRKQQQQQQKTRSTERPQNPCNP